MILVYLRYKVAMFKHLGFLFVFASILAAQGEDAMLTRSKWNGKFWNALTSDAKSGYISGYSEGVLMGCAVFAFDAKCLERMHEHWPSNMTNVDAVKAVDQFFSDTANVRIPLRWGLHWVLRKIGGASISTLDSDLSAMRKQYN